MMTVNEVSKLSGISVRTLHYYDQIGLLHPDQVSEAGYRLYGQASLERLQQILLFRQLEFPLKEIKDIIDSPDFNKEEALDQQIQMLRLQQEHLSGLINLALEIKKNGVNKMDFKPFDTSKLDEYAKEAKERWGDSAAYQESARKTKNYTKEDWNMANEQITSVFAEFGKLKELPPESPDAQMAVKNCKISSASSITPVIKKFWPVSAKCTLLISASRTTSTRWAVTAPQNLPQEQSPATANNTN